MDPSKQSICPDCINALPELGVHCPKCAEPNRHGEVCGHCLSRPPAFDFVICPYRYAGPIKRLIAKFKHKPSLVGSDVLYQILARQLTDHQFDYIIPTPYHWQRLLLRGHNPVRELAVWLSRHLNTPLLDGLTRIKSQNSQKELNRKYRLKNLHGAFSLNLNVNKLTIQDANILLIDDVLTTGATAHSAALTLRRAGAKSVCIACLARTPVKG